MRVMELFICGKENNPITCEDGLFMLERLQQMEEYPRASVIRDYDSFTE